MNVFLVGVKVILYCWLQAYILSILIVTKLRYL